jgi:hypothetical protein
MCISAGRVTSALRPEHDTWDSPYIAPKKRGISGLLSQDKPVESIISLYDGQPGKYSRPVFKFKAVTQAFAVYPNQPELISSRTLIKLQGMYCKEGIPFLTKDEEYESQMLLMPDLEGGGIQEMLRWLIGGHVAFAEPF